MFCPKCRAEYREGFTECSDCHVPLSAERPPAKAEPVSEAPPDDHNFEPVAVFETNNQMQAAMARGLLEDAGIPFIMRGQVTTTVQDVDGFLRKWLQVQVSREREAEARELLAHLTTEALIEE
jgi:hypothetical protein